MWMIKSVVIFRKELTTIFFAIILTPRQSYDFTQLFFIYLVYINYKCLLAVLISTLRIAHVRCINILTWLRGSVRVKIQGVTKLLSDSPGLVE